MKSVKWLMVAALALTGFGCVAQSQYDQLNNAYLNEKEQVVDLQQRLEALDAQIRAMKEADRLRTESPDLKKALEQALADRDAAKKALADAEQRFRDLGPGSVTVISGPTNEALKEFAAKNPGLVTYDEKRGMLRFASDLTFTPGSTEVSAQAQTALGQLAAILKTPDAAKYEAIIVGHTDNQPIARVKALHPTNWHLSVHRAIAVKDVLQRDGVPPVRMEVAGYGEFRPIIPNGPKGAQANRRVELFLRPSTWSGIEPGAAAPEAPETVAPPTTPRRTTTPTRPTEPPELFK